MADAFGGTFARDVKDSFQRDELRPSVVNGFNDLLGHTPEVSDALRSNGLNPLDFAPGMGVYDGIQDIKAGNYGWAALGIASEVPLLKGLRGAEGGFRSFSAFKRTMGPAGDGMHWHHIVEQTAGNVSRFGAESIHNVDNLIRLDAGIHRQVSAYYSSKLPFTEGNTLRQWLGGKSFEEQRQFGLELLDSFGVAR